MSTINHSRVSRVSLLSESRSTVDPPTYLFLFFYPVIIVKTIFFSFLRFLPPFISIAIFWDIFIGNTKNCAPSPIYCSALIFFFSRYFSEIWEFRRNEHVTSRYRLHGFYVIQGEGGWITTSLGWIMYFFVFFIAFLLFVKFLPRKAKLSRITRNLILFRSFFPLLITSGEKDQFQGLINFLLLNESITRGAIL